MHLIINNEFEIVAGIHIFPTKDMYALEITFEGVVEQRLKRHHAIVSALRAKGCNIYDEMSLDDKGLSNIKILKCTILNFIDLMRAAQFIMEEKEPELEF
jgi:hypothetical protein